jgi:HD-GYP domain-containing protein (c-di-GMP phosphodiesterase class II)
LHLLVYHHHERWDGAGYPDRLKGDAIPLAARLIAVVDAFNAMTTNRPYRKGFSMAEAVTEIKHCTGTQFDPRVVEIFLRLLERGIDARGNASSG